MDDSQLQRNPEVPTLLITDSKGNELLCFLEQIVPINGTEYVLLTPVDTPVTLFRLSEDSDPELIKTINLRNNNKQPVSIGEIQAPKVLPKIKYTLKSLL